MATTKTLLLFGPGAMSLDEAYFNRIFSFMKDDAASQWASQAITDIGTVWDSLCASIPNLHQVNGAKDAQRLAGWLREGALPPKSAVANLPNTILGPLVIIAQLAEYLQHVKSQSAYAGAAADGFSAPSPSHTETVGCCLGVFSALVVSSSSSWAQFCHNAAAVLRVVFVLGALSDVEDAHHDTGPSVSLVAFWKGGRSVLDLNRVIEKNTNVNFPESSLAEMVQLMNAQNYISVLYDDNRATVTAPTRTVAALKSDLQAAGVGVNEAEFHGRFHAGPLYESDLELFFAFCKKNPTFQLPSASCLVLPTRVNSERCLVGSVVLLEVATRAFLVEQFNWIKTFRAAVSSVLLDRNARVVEFGPERCIPPTLLRRLQGQITHFDFEKATSTIKAGARRGAIPGVAENDVAVIGMSCSVAGASDLEEYWKILLEGKSQHKELLPNDRFVMETQFRPFKDGDNEKKWFGNFLDDYDAFDHRFFRKSPREVLHMDPQQRLILQAAYQAVAQSGYYHTAKPNSRIGCYIGVVANDYENNIACTKPTAFSATGALRSYIAGKVSHYFGWTGPGMTLDTACSASTVAIDLACRAILSGDCTAALAGGTNFYTTPMFFQNLAAGSFISVTGQCKPFDAKADGYCRGEAVGAVFLKKLSTAIQDGDQILGVISATAINQNQNSTPIFVPNPVSLTDVFRTVVAKSGLSVRDISVAEAHGTGTPVGDPVEYDSIRQVFGGPSARAGLKPLQVGSLKGLIGHTEGASGVIALIKILLMMHEGCVPPQASFSSINPLIKAVSSDNMEITTTPKPWEDEFKVALINNYGAAGSNASMVIKQAPKMDRGKPVVTSTAFKVPFYISGLDEKAIKAYAARLRQFIAKNTMSGNDLAMENLAFNINRQSNWNLGRALVFKAESLQDLDEKLASCETFETPIPRPVILCFGGQVAKFVGLDRGVLEKSAVLRSHLDASDKVCRSLGAGSIFDKIFQREPIDDPAVLQPLLFSMQYSCAMSWMDCGIKPAALVGHSFGELTALCVSGVLSLEDALRMVYGRSKLIRDMWGPEKGAMIAVEAELTDVNEVLSAVNTRIAEEHGTTSEATIACFNGPKSFTIAGSTAAIDDVQNSVQGRSMKHKRLDVTNAFHSKLVDHLKSNLGSLGQALRFTAPKIPIERAMAERHDAPLTSSYVFDHMRQPVYFDHAVQRLHKQYPAAVWLEAGSNATITSMASKGLGMPKTSIFQPVNITSSSNGLSQLIDATMNLWKSGLRVSFWPHSRLQTYQYSPLILPPYQFEKQRHWLDLKPPQQALTVQATMPTESDKPRLEAPPTGPLTLLGYGSDGENHYLFRVNIGVAEFTEAVSGHMVGNAAESCPTMFQIDLGIRAVMAVDPDLDQSRVMRPQIINVANSCAITPSVHRSVHLDLKRLDTKGDSWDIRFTSKPEGSSEMVHMTGQLYFPHLDDARSGIEFGRLERLVTHERCLRALAIGEDTEDVIQGQSIYRIGSDIIKYGRSLQGLQKLVGQASVSAGTVVRRRSDAGLLSSSLGDIFIQTGSIWVNCLARNRVISNDTVYVIGSIEQWIRSPELLCQAARGLEQNEQAKEWHVLAQHKHITSGDSFVTDIFVFDAASGALLEVILGIHFIPARMEDIPTRQHNPEVDERALKLPVISQPYILPAKITLPSASNLINDAATSSNVNLRAVKPPAMASRRKGNTKADIWAKLQPVLADISGLDMEEIKETDALADIGIDSLMGMEMAREVETTFSCTLEQSELVGLVDVPGILDYLQAALDRRDGISPSSHSSDATPSEDSFEDGNGVLASTPDPKSAAADYVVLYDTKDSVVEMPPAAVLDAFRESKARTDYFLKSRGCAGYLSGVSQKQTRLCLVLITAAFKRLGCDLEAAQPGDVLQPVPVVEKHQRFHDYLYKMLEETRIINCDGGIITRTAIPLPSQTAEAILQDLMKHHADNGASHQLTYNVGSRMADVLSGKADGPQLIFGDAKNRELVASFYGELPFNKLYFELMADFLSRLATKLKLSSQSQTTLKILEMGAGTGGTTKLIAPMLAKLGIAVEYTFTDLSPSLVAQAKRKFKQYPFMKFAVHDIEKPPAEAELIGSQHIVIASNAVHATHSLKVSNGNIRKFLRPDGFLILLEMMRSLHWVDVVWGTLEGWWLFDDGRSHAIVDEKHWEQELLASGFKHVEWTDGKLPEIHVQRVLIAMAADVPQPLHSLPAGDLSASMEMAEDHEVDEEDLQTRQAAADEYLASTIRGFSVPRQDESVIQTDNTSVPACVLVTGATGSLGSHIVAHLVSLPTVQKVYCLNRHGPGGLKARANADPQRRQIEALESKAIYLDESSLSKLEAIKTDSSEAQLGLDRETYSQLVSSVTHIIHNAFPVNGLRSLKQNEPQFATMRNLVDLAAKASAYRPLGDDSKVTFQLVSSLSAVGMYPHTHGGQREVPEEPLDVDSALPNGYGGAKMVCERVLRETLGRHPDRFRAMTVRLGQVSGSVKSGYWNHMEVLGFLFKSAQTLRAFPAVKGVLSWVPLESASASLADLLLREGPDCYPVYHVDNPIVREWEDMVPVLAGALGGAAEGDRTSVGVDQARESSPWRESLGESRGQGHRVLRTQV
ncbi:Type I Polyketide synthases (Type I PKS) [Apiospora hydei]|uniref:Type I Polyketide synthases (Type I PKS) n=1 Tax=Apiospora hydei TaxID=1337664 RepID=A0ABR1VW40_9PEZI